MGSVQTHDHRIEIRSRKKASFRRPDGCPSFMLTVALSLHPELLGQGLYLWGIEVCVDDDDRRSLI